ncbi:MAG: hypothetical protein L0214_00905 [candidate division NC10 bacterium]|nr:hypothetical protein [candidate division NC10 bacterium]
MSSDIHRLVVSTGHSFGASQLVLNCLESINAPVAQRTDKVTRWRTSDQKHRWLAAALLDIAPRLPRVKGYGAVPLLRAALHGDIRTKEITVGDQTA